MSFNFKSASAISKNNVGSSTESTADIKDITTKITYWSRSDNNSRLSTLELEDGEIQINDPSEFHIPVIGEEVEIASTSQEEEDCDNQSGQVADSGAGQDDDVDYNYGDGDCDEDDDLNDDLYGDLETAVFHTTKDINVKTRTELEDRVRELESCSEKERAQLKLLNSKFKASSKQNSVLLKNATSLLEIAQLEIHRKNFTLTQVQRKLESISRKVMPQWDCDIVESTNVTKDDLNDLLQKITEATSETAAAKLIRSDIAKIVADYKAECAAKQQKKAELKWERKIRLKNTVIYLFREQGDFTPIEKVTFPQSDRPRRTEQIAPPPNMTHVKGGITNFASLDNDKMTNFKQEHVRNDVQKIESTSSEVTSNKTRNSAPNKSDRRDAIEDDRYSRRRPNTTTNRYPADPNKRRRSRSSSEERSTWSTSSSSRRRESNNRDSDRYHKRDYHYPKRERDYYPKTSH